MVSASSRLWSIAKAATSHWSVLYESRSSRSTRSHLTVRGAQAPNVAHERPSRRAKPACESPPRWAGYASQPPANPSLVCSVLWTKERGQHALLGFDLELIDIEHEHWQKKKDQNV